MPCGFAHASQSKPGISAGSLASANLLFVFAGFAAVDLRPLRARQLGLERDDGARVATADRARPASVKIFARYRSYSRRTSTYRASSLQVVVAIGQQRAALRDADDRPAGSSASSSTTPANGPPTEAAERYPASAARSRVVRIASIFRSSGSIGVMPSCSRRASSMMLV